MNKLPIYEIFIEKDENYLGLALVDNPAIERDFIYFAEDKEQMTFNDEKMIVKGPALIPNKLIYRNDKFGERYVYFSEETIVNFVENLMDKKDNKFNLDHTDEYLNATMIESYFATEPNEFKVPKNSWIVSLKIKDNEVWNKIKNGEYNGFSVQGIFSNELMNKFSKETNMNVEMKEKLMKAINTILFGEEPAPVVVDTPVVDVAPVVDPVIDVAPVVDTPVVDNEPTPVVDAPIVEALNVDKVNELIIASQTETISKLEAMINKLNDKIDSFGNLPVPSKNEKEIIDNKGVIQIENPAAKYFIKNK